MLFYNNYHSKINFKKMKTKFRLILFLLTLIILFPSCKKNYSCECNVSIAYNHRVEPNLTNDIDNFTTIKPIERKLTKKQAESTCSLTEKMIIDNYSRFLGSGWEIVNSSAKCLVK